MSDVHQPINILLVDDRPEQLLVLESVLSDLGQNLVRANSGREALRFLLHNDCAVILLDVNMPDLDGFETASLIRQHPRSQKIPIIFFTADDETETHVTRGYSLGAVDYIHTPVLPEVLLAKVAVFVELARRTAEVRQEAEKLEGRVRERTAELETLNQQLQAEIAERKRTELDRARLLAEAQEGVRRRDEFLAMLAHELRNPLASIVCGVDVMRLIGLSDPELEEARDIIERQAGHMSALLQDLLDISRITRGKIELNRRPLDFAAVIRDAVTLQKDSVSARRHVLSLVLPDEPLMILGDATRLQQIVVNLLNNAVKYTDPGGRIEVLAERDGENASVHVRDTGIGIDPEKAAAIFEPFVQLDRSHSRASEGLGIGLTLVQRLVELHGGKVSVESGGPGQGSRFTVTVPLLSAEEAADSVEARPAAPRAVNGAVRRIVVVEDNGDVRQMLCTLLGRHGHQVSISIDGPAGVDTIRREKPDLALVDVGLPGLDGYEVAARVRADPECGAVQLVAMTGYGQPDDCRRALRAGFDAHLVKPVHSDQLLALLHDSPHIPNIVESERPEAAVRGR
jgi:signal transduction histidine kinase